MPHAWNWLRTEAIDCYNEKKKKNSSSRRVEFLPHILFFSYLIPLIIIQEANRR